MQQSHSYKKIHFFEDKSQRSPHFFEDKSYCRTEEKLKEKIIGTNTKNIILAHRSETNNTEEKIKEAIEEVELRKDINIYIAKQNEESSLIEV